MSNSIAKVAAKVAVIVGVFCHLAAAQTNTVRATRLSVGPGTPAVPVVGDVRLVGLGTTGGTQVLLVDSNFDVIRRILAKADLPAAIAYEDEANIFTLAQTISNASPTLNLQETDAGPDQKYFRWIAEGGVVYGQHLNDAYTVAVSNPWASSAFGSLVLSPYSKQILPAASYEGAIGSPLRKWLSLDVAEVHSDVLVAQETLATTAGRWLVAPATSLIEDIGSAATTIKVKQNNLANGDVVYMENNLRVEYMTVTSGATRLNRAGVGNASAESGTTDWSSGGSVALASVVDQHWHGGKSLRWTYTSGTANVVFNPSGMQSNSTAYTVSVYVKRFDGAAVVPVAGGAYRLYVDAQNGVLCDPTSTDVGNGWYRLACSGTTGASLASGTGIASIPTSVVHFFDAVQVELGTTVTPWSRDSASYTVTRNADGSGADVWEAGTGIVNTRQTGAGLIDCYATQGFSNASAIGPTCSFMVRTSSTYNAMSPRTAIGNLNGLYGYATDTYGFATGNPSGTYVTMEPTNGFRIIGGGVTKVQIDASGNASFASGNAMIDGTSVRITANSSNAYAAGNGFNFTPTVNTGGNFGLAAHDLASFRGLRLENIQSGSATSTIGLQATNSATTVLFSLVAGPGGVGIINLGANEVRPDTALNAKLGESTDIWGSSYIRHMWLPENGTPPSTPASGTEMSMRMCGDKFVITFNDGGTVRYKYLDLTGTGITWTHATGAAPTGC